MVKINRETFEDINGNIQFLDGCSIDALDKLRHLYRIFWDEVITIENWSAYDFQVLCKINPSLLRIGKQIVKTCGIKYKSLNFAIFAALVFSYTDNEGESHLGKLHEVNFPNEEIDESKTGELITFDENYYQTFTALVDIHHGDFEKAYQTLKNTPYHLVKQYLRIKSEQYEEDKKDPEGKKAKFLKAKKKYMDKFKEVDEKQEKRDQLMQLVDHQPNVS